MQLKRLQLCRAQIRQKNARREGSVMRLSSKSQYGLKACFILAQNYPLRCVSASALEKEIAVSSKYIEKIMRNALGGGRRHRRARRLGRVQADPRARKDHDRRRRARARGQHGDRGLHHLHLRKVRHGHCLAQAVRGHQRGARFDDAAIGLGRPRRRYRLPLRRAAACARGAR